MNETLTDLLTEAAERKTEIAAMIRKAREGQYVALYESDNGTTLSYLNSGFHTPRAQISFSRYSDFYFKSALSQVEHTIEIESFILTHKSK